MGILQGSFLFVSYFVAIERVCVLRMCAYVRLFPTKPVSTGYMKPTRFHWGSKRKQNRPARRPRTEKATEEVVEETTTKEE